MVPADKDFQHHRKDGRDSGQSERHNQTCSGGDARDHEKGRPKERRGKERPEGQKRRQAKLTGQPRTSADGPGAACAAALVNGRKLISAATSVPGSTPCSVAIDYLFFTPTTAGRASDTGSLQKCVRR